MLSLQILIQILQQADDRASRGRNKADIEIVTVINRNLLITAVHLAGRTPLKL